MTDSRPGSPSEPTEPLGNQYPAYTDPAYAGQSPYTPSYAAPVNPPGANPTEPLPQYWTQTYGQGPPGMPPQQPPEPPKSPRWLWIAAGAAVLVVVGLVVALVIANSSSKKQTVVAPIPAMPSPSTTPPLPTTTRSPTPMLPLPTIPFIPSPPTSTSVAPGATETVVYQVTGRGRAINITYVDTGSLMQTEFNVLLPWRKEVELPKPAQDSASVTIINVGRDVTCTVTVAGVQVRERTGAGLTICSASG
jgi:hypothetical protein